MRKTYIKSILMSCFILVNLNANVKSIDDTLNEARKIVTSIDTNQLLKILKKNPNIKIIDVRTKSDILRQGGYIKSNQLIRIPRDKLEFMISNSVNDDEKFIVSCFDGKISLLATQQLLKMGYKNVLHYKDSYRIWSKSNLAISSLDKYPDSMLYSKIQKISNRIYTSIGQTAPPSYENSNHNNNLGFVIGDKYVLVWNAGGNYLLAKSFHDEIKKITNKPVKYVVLENSQSHAILGSSYWKEIGATIISQEIAKKEIMNFGEKILNRKKRILRDKLLGTKIIIPNSTFKNKKVFDLGGIEVQALYFGYAHEHSDIVLWIPQEQTVFAGDIAFNQRLLPIFNHTQTKKWLDAWEKFEELKATIIIPGHGDITNMQTVRKYTKDYLVYLRTQITNILDDDSDLIEAYNIDMSKYEHLDTYKELSKQNIARLFKQMEFED